MRQLLCKILFVPFIFFASFCFGQHSNLRQKKILAKGIVQFDSLSIVPKTFFIAGIDSSFYSIDYINARVVWKKDIAVDSAIISYRVFNFRFNQVVSKYSFDSIKNNFVAIPAYSAEEKDNSLFNFGKLDYNGSFGRSISFGNSQDAVFNSQLNLQLGGYLGDSIKLSAAITDNNIPIQPDGTTQQLNEFDKVLLQFSKKNWEIDLGDIDLRQNQSYFLNFYKRLQGASYTQQFSPGKNIVNKTIASGAIAKGKFARNVFEGLEGNQGPYRLQGNNNELFFIVLAGTEKVFIDGIQLQRGEDQDYVINYNTAEVTFTPKHLITKDTRIQVEFEYADRNYLNSMLYVNNETDFGKKFILNVSAYSNVDAKSSPLNQTLDNQQKQFLSGIGDSIENALYPSAIVDTFSASAILYKKIDTLYNSIHDSIYVYSTNPDSAKYSLNFIDVGINKGNYIPLFAAANGKTYQWIQPVNGVPQGNFEPAIFLVTPKKQQVISVSGLYQLNKNTSIQAEVAASKYDANIFSSLDKGNDDGHAAKISLQHNTSWKNKKEKVLLLNAKAGYEFVDKNFKPVERLRPVEFARDWGLPLLLLPATEQLPSFSLQLSDEKNNSLLYQFSSYIRSDHFKGIRNSVIHAQNIKGWQLNDIVNVTTSTTPTDKGFFLTPSVDVSKTITSFHNYILGANYYMEYNKVRNEFADTLTPLSYAFQTATVYIKSDQLKNNRWSFNYFTRINKLPYQKELLKTDYSRNYNFQTELLQNKHEQLRFNLTYRQLFVTNTAINILKPDNSLLGRAEYSVNEWNGFLTGNALYELGASQEQKRDFSYVEVPAGKGIYQWNDYNHDGIQQLNEFEIAVFEDQKKFIRIYTPTNEYIKANYTQFNYSFSLNPKAIAETMHNKNWKNFITRFLMQSSLQTFKKQLSSGNPTYNPFKGNIADTALIALNYILNNTISFNRFSSSWGIDLSNLQTYNKSLLTYGAESSKQNTWTLKSRIIFSKFYMFEIAQTTSTNNLLTPSFANRNYNIQNIITEPKFTYTYNTTFRIQAGYQYMRKSNAEAYGGEKATINSINLESSYNAFSNTSLQAKFSYSNINFKGLQNTPVSYIMLDALLPGKNFLWNINLTKRLINNLEISFEYEGRKPGSTRVIHTGRASIRALL